MFIYIDRTRVNAQRLERALRHFEEELFTLSHLEPVSDEEQAEIVALLETMSDEDKEIASVERAAFTSDVVI